MKNHYERVICLCCFLIYFVNIGLPSTSFNVFQPYLAALPYVGNTGGSLILGSRTLVTLLSMFFVGRYVDRMGARKGAALAALLTCAGFLLYSLASSMPGFFAGALFAGAGYGLGGSVIITLVLRRWFATGVGTAVGIATMGSGISSLVLSPLVARIIENVSLSWGFRFESFVALAVALVIYALLRDTPEEMGKQPYRNESPSRKNVSEHTALSAPLPRGAKILLLVGATLLGGVAVDAYNYFSILLTSQGMDTLHAATLIALLGGVLTASKFISGLVIDRVGTLRGTMMLFALMTTGLICACFSGSNPALAYVAVLLFGFGVTLGSLGISLWSMELSTPDTLTSTVKNLQIAYALGGFTLSLMPGPLMDLFGSYIISYVVFATLSLVCAVIIASIYLRYRK